jgi:uncharacterized membrane protein (UPF0127 family)
MKKIVQTLCLAIIAIVLLGCHKEAPKDEPVGNIEFREDGSLRIESPQGLAKGNFSIEIAETENALHQGLKYRENMNDDQGMLFVFDGKVPYGFWMQDTYMPLDMLFIDESGVIFQIEENTTPFSEERIESMAVNKYTLELKAGMVDKHGIEPGDRIVWNRNK